jgi:glycosyltransferase involved in cell wall biosynthesis
MREENGRGSGRAGRRVLWLLNHTAARRFEVPMLKRIGFREIYLPKVIPQDVGFRSADIDHSEDAHLTIDPGLLTRMNEVNWYKPVPPELWAEVSAHFDVCFFIGYDPKAVALLLEHFAGAAIWRAYGLNGEASYSQLSARDVRTDSLIRRARRRFWLGQAYDNLAEIEPDLIKRRAVYLPLGMANAAVNDQWEGGDRRVLFVCPDIVFNSYYRKVYEDFRRDVGDLPHAIGGAQPLKVDDRNVLGFLPLAEHRQNMRRMSAMYYHSREPRHVHFHPFEAVQAGMPLVFMADGLLDRLGGRDLPGRARTTEEARQLLRRLLDGDRSLIEAIRRSQHVLLECMKVGNCVEAWDKGFDRILDDLDGDRVWVVKTETRRPRIAIILPIEYRGGTLRAAKAVSLALKRGSELAGEEAEIVFGHVDDPSSYPDEEFGELEGRVSRRAFRWTVLTADQARRAMHYRGFSAWQPLYQNYILPNDGIGHFTDCDLIIFISDRLSMPVLPIRPYALIVYDYLQRYHSVLGPGADTPFLIAARLAQKVFVTTEFTRADAVNYAGVPEEKVVRLPIVAPSLVSPAGMSGATDMPAYFLWTTNLATHKNHMRAMAALDIYYGELGGTLHCVVTGVGTDRLFDTATAEGSALNAKRRANRVLKSRVRALGDLSDARFARMLAGATFLWHPALIDNGTFSVVEAAQFSVPSASSDYPAMHELDDQFRLSLTYFDPRDVRDMAERLKWMELNHLEKRIALPDQAALEEARGDRVASAYWAELRRCL